jgi:uroporphyrinogen III methyltransferase/synthase
VFLVGAGPGDPDLITLRGAEVLRRADVVVYDALASPELLDLAPEDAERVNVGRRGHDEPTRSQEEINALVLRHARAGRSVVRLKGGDPLVFGRGGEEASACRAAGIPFEIVPGVSSAIAALAYAGIPVTDRRHAASFAVVTGHKDPTRVAQSIRWDALATASDTLVILMGLRNIEEIVGRLLAHGRSPETPAAAVMLGTTPSQRVVEAPLRDLPQRIREASLAAPTAVVVGDVVRLREELAWFEGRPLFGKRVLVTRPRGQAEDLARELRAAGAEPVVVPLIRIVPAEGLERLDAALEKLDEYDAILFTSRNAVRFFADRWAPGQGAVRVPVICVGPATATEALRRGLPAQKVPGDRFDAEAMLRAVVQLLPPGGRRFLFPCAEQARDVLPRGLREAGARVDAIPVYRTIPAPVDEPALRRSLVEGDIDALTFTSPSTVRSFVERLDAASLAAARRCIVAAIGSVTAEALERAELAPDALAERAQNAALVEALIDCVRARRAQEEEGA